MGVGCGGCCGWSWLVCDSVDCIGFVEYGGLGDGVGCYGGDYGDVCVVGCVVV